MPPQVATETNVGEETLDDDAVPRDDGREVGPDPAHEPAFDPAPPEEFTSPPEAELAAPFDGEIEPSPETEAQADETAVLGATGDLISDESPEAVDGPAVAAVESDEPARRSVRQRVRARQLRARKVRRTIRHIDPWSVLKFSVFFFALVWMVVIMAGVVLWSLAVNSGLVTEVEDLVIELFDLTSFSIDANVLFRVSVLVGGAMALGGALFMGVLAVLFNLLSDLLGGIRVSVIEEETARRIAE